jgi:hypothetical protein
MVIVWDEIKINLTLSDGMTKRVNKPVREQGILYSLVKM